jgi:hypothetical protein
MITSKGMSYLAAVHRALEVMKKSPSPRTLTTSLPLPFHPRAAPMDEGRP